MQSRPEHSLRLLFCCCLGFRSLIYPKKKGGQVVTVVFAHRNGVKCAFSFLLILLKLAHNEWEVDRMCGWDVDNYTGKPGVWQRWDRSFIII